MATTFEFFTEGDDAAQTMSTAAYPGQTFTIGTTGADLTFNVSSIDIRIIATTLGAGTLTAEIFEVDPAGLPRGSAISTGTHTMNPAWDGTTHWVNIPVSIISLKASTKYALTVAGSGGAGEWDWRKDTANGYAGGAALTTADTGSSWTEVGANDMLFQINGGDYAGTLCTLADAVNKGGANANAVATNESLVSDWVRQAEGKIACVTEFDWVDAYSSISEDVRFILNETASEIAAIKIITYDMDAYKAETSEAETMINVYRENINFNLNLLSQERVKDFLESDT